MSPSITGEINITCPSTIAVGVRKIPSPPSGPAREKITKTRSPTDTVGKLNRVWIALVRSLFPGKRLKWIKLPSGRQSKAVMLQDIAAIVSDILAASITSGSSDTMRCIAFTNACQSSSNVP
jgi:hypothetical protein